jgi:hypothetical protein
MRSAGSVDSSNVYWSLASARLFLINASIDSFSDWENPTKDRNMNTMARNDVDGIVGF